MNLPTLDDLSVEGKRVLLRVDFNVPLKAGKITDETRIVAALPTIRRLLDRGATVICCSHLGRPKGKRDPSLTLDAVAHALADRLQMRVRKTSEPNGPPEDLATMPPDQVGLLENLRFDPREEANDITFAKELASLADVYVNDAFGAVHRAHASVAAVVDLLPHGAGLLLQKEVEVLGRLIESPTQPFVVVLGGAKVSDKIGVVRNLLDKADSILIGGAMANTFLAAKGTAMGTSKIEEDRLDDTRQTLEAAEGSPAELLLPVDLVVGDSFEENTTSQVVSTEDVPAAAMALDIGPITREEFSEAISSAATILWNGPMGVFEWKQFEKGTLEIAQAVVSSEAFTVAGGGDTAAALSKFGLTDRVSHVSTGGGASLEFLEGRELPGLEAITQRS